MADSKRRFSPDNDFDLAGRQASVYRLLGHAIAGVGLMTLFVGCSILKSPSHGTRSTGPTDENLMVPAARQPMDRSAEQATENVRLTSVANDAEPKEPQPSASVPEPISEPPPMPTRSGEENVESPNPAMGPPAQDVNGRLHQVLDRAVEFNRRYPDFVCRLARTERLRGTLHDPELMLMKFRREPRSVHLKWLDSRNEGRETIWVESQNDGMMISRGGRGDLLLAGKTLRLDPNGSLARSKSWQPVTDTGLDVIVGRIQGRLQRVEQGDASIGSLKVETGPDPERAGVVMDWIIHHCEAKVDPDIPSGGMHRWGFRPDNGRVEVAYAADTQGKMLYHFRFERFIPVGNLTDADFDPEAVWPKNVAGNGGKETMAAHPTESLER